MKKHYGEKKEKKDRNALLRDEGKLTCCKMNAKICRFLLSACSVFFLNLWSFKTAGRQTASCLKFMKHLLNSPGRDLSWQPFTSPTQARLVWHPSGPHWIWCMFYDTLFSCIIHNTPWVCFDQGKNISNTHIRQISHWTLLTKLDKLWQRTQAYM